MHEIFVAGIFTEIRPVWVDDLESRPKNLESLCLVPYIKHWVAEATLFIFFYFWFHTVV
jgi:hypothetical protein